MKTASWLDSSTKQLKEAGVETARLDCLVLLEDAIQKNRAHLLAHPEFELDKPTLNKLQHQIQKRSTHLPLAYIRGKTEFYDREFIITKDVLEPRPESENIISLLLEQSDVRSVIDLGSGSGALGITAKLELPKARVTLIDIDQKCLDVCLQNAAQHSASVETRLSNLLQDMPPALLNDSVILANLPYVPSDFPLNTAAQHEPSLAIFGGHDGLNLYRELFEQIKELDVAPKALICESLPFQHLELQEIALRYGLTQTSERELIQVFSYSGVQPQG